MKKPTLSAGITALALALTMSFAFGQTASDSETAASSPGNVADPGMTYRQGQGNYGPGMMSGQSTGQPQRGYFAGMMGGYSANSIGGYGWIWLPILLVLLTGGFVMWVVRRKTK